MQIAVLDQLLDGRGNRNGRYKMAIFCVLTVAALATALIIVSISPEFAWGTLAAQRPTTFFLGLMLIWSLIFAGQIHVLSRFSFGPFMPQAPGSEPFIKKAPRGLRLITALGDGSPTSGKLLAVIFAFGLLLRLIFSVSTPIWEDDHYRYLWEGLVTSHGFSPYAHSPLEVARGAATELPSGPEPALQQLAQAYPEVIGRVNHPQFSSVYPPVAQAGFALAALIAPGQLWAWRLLLLAGELIAFFVMLRWLSQARLPVWLVALYWWNPLIIKEFVNSAHLDALLAPLFVLTLSAVQARKPIRAAIWIALATGIKFWPILFLALIATQWTPRTRPRCVLAIFGGLIALGLFLSPFQPLHPPEHSGLTAFALAWNRNAFAFDYVASASEAFLRAFNWALPISPAELARGFCGLTVLGIAGFCVSRPMADARAIALCALTIGFSFFFLSPAQYPWYCAALLPFAAAAGARHFALACTLFLPIYYVFFQQAEWIDEGWRRAILAFEHIPLLLALIWDLLDRKWTAAANLMNEPASTRTGLPKSTL